MVKLNQSNLNDIVDSKLKIGKIVQCYDNPDDESRIGPYIIRKKKFRDYVVLITANIETRNILTVYKIYQDFIRSNLQTVDPSTMLNEFLEDFGLDINYPRFERGKCVIDLENKIFIPGALKKTHYLKALSKKKSHWNQKNSNF